VDLMTGVLRPGRFPFIEVEPLPFNGFQFDTLEAIILLCAEAGEASEDRDDYAAARMVLATFPPVTIGHPVPLVHPDDDDRIIEDEVDLALAPAEGVPIHEHQRLREVVTELRAFLAQVDGVGFAVEF